MARWGAEGVQDGVGVVDVWEDGPSTSARTGEDVVEVHPLMERGPVHVTGPRGQEPGSEAGPTVPEWATLGAYEAVARQLRNVVTIADPPAQDPHVTVLVRKPMAETEAPIMLNRRARRAVKAIKKQIARTASKRHARRAA